MMLAGLRSTRGAAVALAAAALCLVSACGSQPAGSPSPAPPATAPGTPAAAGTSPAAGSTPAAAAAKVTSCSVITRAQASAALGQPVQPPILGRATVEGGVACVFYGPGVPAGTSPDVAVPDSVRVVLVVGPNARKWFDDYRSKVHAVPISGIGDQCYYDGYASLSVLRADDYVRIAVGISRNLRAEETLARKATYPT